MRGTRIYDISLPPSLPAQITLGQNHILKNLQLFSFIHLTTTIKSGHYIFDIEVVDIPNSVESL